MSSAYLGAAGNVYKEGAENPQPCIFSGKTAIYYGGEAYFNDHRGHILLPNQPLAVCDKTAANLAALNRNDLFISGSTWFYDGGAAVNLN